MSSLLIVVCRSLCFGGQVFDRPDNDLLRFRREEANAAGIQAAGFIAPLGNDAGGRLKEHTWLPVDYADGLIRIGTQSAIIQPEAGALLRKLMIERGLPAPPPGRTLESVCLAPELCDDVQPEELQDLK